MVVYVGAGHWLPAEPSKTLDLNFATLSQGIAG